MSESISLLAILLPLNGLESEVWVMFPSAACACVAAPYGGGGPEYLRFSVNSSKPEEPVVEERVGESGILLKLERRGRFVDDDRAWFGCMIFFRRKQH